MSSTNRIPKPKLGKSFLESLTSSNSSKASGVRESRIDWVTIILYLLIIGIGWANLYSTSMEAGTGVFDMHTHHGKEALFILIGIGAGVVILFLDTKFMEYISYIFYGLTIFALLAVLMMSKVGGASSWFAVGGFKLQPTEFAKVATVMALAKYMSRFNFSLSRTKDFLIAGGILALPSILVILQNDAGSALVFAGLVLMFYREGLHPIYLIAMVVLGAIGVTAIVISTTPNANLVLAIVIGLVTVVSLAGLAYFKVIQRLRLVLIILGIGAILSTVAIIVPSLVKPHHSARLRVLFASESARYKDKDLKKVYYNLRESLVAIGSGGLTGKGYGNGTHTRGDFVPEEHTDYIFCVVGEEHGFVGSSVVLLLFLVLLGRILYVAENAKSHYARVYGYGIASIIFMHVFINVGMTIGLLPTVGIPLSFYSYGGSSVIAFTLMLFILMNHYSYRLNILN